MPYIHFTDEQKRQANSADLVEFLRSKGESLIRSGSEFRMSSNHSVTVGGNEWYDHAAEKGGGPVSFLKEFYGMNYQEAVLTLLGQDSRRQIVRGVHDQGARSQVTSGQHLDVVADVIRNDLCGYPFNSAEQKYQRL